MITTTHYFSWNNTNTQLLENILKFFDDLNIFSQIDQKKINQLLKQIITISLNKLNSIVIVSIHLLLPLLIKINNREAFIQKRKL